MINCIKYKRPGQTFTTYEPRHEKTCFCNMRSLVSAFVVHCLDSITPLVSISEISSLYLASVVVQASLSLPWSQIPKTGFLVTWLISDQYDPHDNVIINTTVK